jgi:anti-sigma28 factor (negative regulator of flagellin synthesis)
MQSSAILSVLPLVTPQSAPTSHEDFVRRGKVERLRAMIAAGEYLPKSEDIARSLFVSPTVIRRRLRVR